MLNILFFSVYYDNGKVLRHFPSGIVEEQSLTDIHKRVMVFFFFLLLLLLFWVNV